MLKFFKNLFVKPAKNTDTPNAAQNDTPNAAQNNNWVKLIAAMDKLEILVEKRDSSKDAVSLIAEITHYHMGLSLWAFFKLLSKVINRFGIDGEIEEIVKSLEEIIKEHIPQRVNDEHLNDVVRKLGLILQNRDAWDLCTTGAELTLFGPTTY